MNISNLNGENGFTIINLPAGSASSVAGIGDINGDHLSDIVVGCGLMSIAFLIFGAKRFNATFDVQTLDGSNGVKLFGSHGSGFGGAVSGTSSINHNNKSGVIVGAPDAHQAAGSAFVFLGADHFPPELNTSILNGTNGFEITGPLNAQLGAGITSIDNFATNRGPAIVVGALLENTVYVILDASSVV
jgi:hypothetical protein